MQRYRSTGVATTASQPKTPPEPRIAIYGLLIVVALTAVVAALLAGKAIA